MYNFSYTLEDADYLEFNIFHFSAAPSHKRFERWLVTFVTCAIAVMTIARIARDEALHVVTAIISGLIGVLLFYTLLRLTIKPVTGLIVRMQISLLKKDGKLPFGKNVQLVFSEDSFAETTEIAETKQKYAVVEKVMEGQRAVYVYTGAMQALIIPLTAFESDEQKREFLSFINSKINN